MMEMIRDYIPEVLTALVTALTAVIGYGVTVFKAKLTEKLQDDEMQHIVENVVKFVEQKSATSKMTSDEKKALAKEKAQEWLTSKGIAVSDTELDILIEAAVQGLQIGKKAAKKEETVG